MWWDCILCLCGSVEAFNKGFGCVVLQQSVALNLPYYNFYHLKKNPIHYKHICSHISMHTLTSMNIYAHSPPLYMSVSKKLDWHILRWRKTSYMPHDWWIRHLNLKDSLRHVATCPSCLTLWFFCAVSFCAIVTIVAMCSGGSHNHHMYMDSWFMMIF